MSETRRTSVFLLERSLLSPYLEIEAYSAITSVFGIANKVYTDRFKNSYINRLIFKYNLAM